MVVAGLRDLMAMQSAGDIVLYGIGAPGGAVSFVDERGAHAGPSEDELHAFILHPPTARLPDDALTHPRQLYPHFLAYREAAAREASRPRRGPRHAPPAEPAPFLAAGVPRPAGDGRGAAGARSSGSG